MLFIKAAFVRLIATICSIQSLAWLLGVFDEVTSHVAQNTEVVLISIFVYLILYFIVYDKTLDEERNNYQNRIEGASLRPTTKKFTPGIRPNRRKSDKSSK